MAKTRAQENRGYRQEALREWLSKKCTGQHLVDNIKKIEELDVTDENFTNSLNKLKTANEQRIKLMHKYLPELKATEISGPDGKAINMNWTVEVKEISA